MEVILSSSWGCDGPAHYSCLWGWVAGYWFFCGIGDQRHVWLDNLSPCPPEACYLKGPWLFPLDESVPALSNMRVLEFLVVSIGPMVLTVLTHFGFARSCPLGSEASLWFETPLLQCTKLFAAPSKHRYMLPLGHLYKLFPCPYTSLLSSG